MSEIESIKQQMDAARNAMHQAESKHEDAIIGLKTARFHALMGAELLMRTRRELFAIEDAYHEAVIRRVPQSEN